ncbi:cell division protein ZapA [Clostridium algifaecis]|uniref:Cell division protein ZapA n=1 Tax=Clostridium algifaecis TaxID=1472040 RepID=A0ABS4KQX9_9CLOT|nr:cell division protein ZapA [Clostridium algifaecis]MBP2032445.1 cell division protein ZapA [Clostridium algifaecis]
MNVVTVTINGMDYNLKGEEQEEYLHKLSSYVDKKVKSILENNNKLSTSSAAILSAVNVADEMFKIKESNDKLLKEAGQFKKSEKVYNDQINSLKKQIEHMENYNQKLQEELKEFDKNKYSKEKDDEIEELKEKVDDIKKLAEDRLNENKNYKFQIQSLKYKVIYFQNKLVENEINLAKEKKRKNPLLKNKSK